MKDYLIVNFYFSLPLNVAITVNISENCLRIVRSYAEIFRLHLIQWQLDNHR